MKKHLRHGLSLWFMLIFGAFALAQQKPPSSAPPGDHTLRVAVDLVMLDVSVTDDTADSLKTSAKTPSRFMRTRSNSRSRSSAPKRRRLHGDLLSIGVAACRT